MAEVEPGSLTEAVFRGRGRVADLTKARSSRHIIYRRDLEAGLKSHLSVSKSCKISTSVSSPVLPKPS